MPASSRSATRRSSASAPMWRDCSPSTGSSTSRCWRCWSPGLPRALLGFVTSFLVLRGSDLTRLMVTLGVALVLREIANQLDWLTGGADGLQGVVMEPLLGLFAFDIFGHTAYVYSLAVLFVLFLLARRIVQFAVRPVAALDQGQSAARRGDRHPRQRPPGRDLHHRGRLCRHRRRAADADHAVRLARRVLDFDRSADVLLVLIIGGTGYLYGGLIGAVAVQADAGLSRQRDAAILAVLDRPAAGRASSWSAASA